MNPLKRFFFPYRYDVSVFSPATGEEDHYFGSSFHAWYADPFLFSQKEGDYQVFVELMDTTHKKGEIAVFNRGSNKYLTVLSEPFHLSFPNVFVLNGKVFMMPESSAIQEVRLYECDHYPDRFTFLKTILHGEKYVDTVLFSYQSDYYLGTYSKSVEPNQLCFFRFNPETLEVGDCIFRQDDPEKILRPAGNPFLENGKVICPMQVGTRSYGENVAFYCFEIRDGEVTLTLIERPTPLPARKKNYQHMHTYNVHGRFACVDFAKNHFSLLQGPYGIPASVRLRKNEK